MDFQKCRGTLIGVGPMSKNTVDVCMELAPLSRAPIMLIASRRQVDAEKLGGGYVNGWTTEAFADYVKSFDSYGNVILARDHGGPWQGATGCTSDISEDTAMYEAKVSYEADIKAGFELIHIDPSLDPTNPPTYEKGLERLFDLMNFVNQCALDAKCEIQLEVGTEEQSGTTNTPEDLEKTLNDIFSFVAKSQGSKPPLFVVVQTGTKVIETSNVGSLDDPIRTHHRGIPSEIQIPRVVDICNRYNVLLKQHNTDYLSDETLKYIPRLGVHAANVAPEFGVVETKLIVDLMRKYQANELLDEFRSLAEMSGKWRKWLVTDDHRDKKLILSGHYVFGSMEFQEIYCSFTKFLAQKSVDLEFEIKQKLRTSIVRYMKYFRLLK